MLSSKPASSLCCTRGLCGRSGGGSKPGKEPAQNSFFYSQRHHPNDDDDDDGGDDDDDRCMRKIQDRGEQDRVWSRAWWQIVKITFLGGDGDFKGTMRKIE